MAGGERFLGVGIAWPFTVDPGGGLAVSRAERDIAQSIRLILSTRPGERRMRPTFGCRIHDLVFAPNSPELAAALQYTVQAGMQRWLGDFWLYSANLCGSRPYRQTLAELRALPCFEEYWRALAAGEAGSLPAYGGAPYEWPGLRFGVFRVMLSHILLPPAYRLRTLLPLDERARRSLEQARAEEFSIIFADKVHWAS